MEYSCLAEFISSCRGIQFGGMTHVTNQSHLPVWSAGLWPTGRGQRISHCRKLMDSVAAPTTEAGREETHGWGRGITPPISRRPSKIIS